MEVIGIDLGGHKISAAVIETCCTIPRIISRIEIQTPISRKFDEVTECVADIIVKLADGHIVSSVGIGVPGFLDITRRKIMRLTNFSALENIEFSALVKDVLKNRGIDADIYMENDANCSALGEGFCGAVRNCTDYVVLTLGSGIGAGIVAGGKLLTGAHGMAGESGHMPIFDGTDVICGCGGTGHLESAASADWIEKTARNAGLPGNFKILWERRSEEKISAIIDPALNALARGIASLIVTLDPEVVVLNGGMSRAEGIADEITVRTLQYLAAPFRPLLNIVVSECGADAALFGAASLCINRG